MFLSTAIRSSAEKAASLHGIPMETGSIFDKFTSRKEKRSRGKGHQEGQGTGTLLDYRYR